MVTETNTTTNTKVINTTTDTVYNREHSMKHLDANQVALMIKDMDHTSIIQLREELKASGNRCYLLRVLYYDYDKQVWIG